MHGPQVQYPAAKSSTRPAVLLVLLLCGTAPGPQPLLPLSKGLWPGSWHCSGISLPGKQVPDGWSSCSKVEAQLHQRTLRRPKPTLHQPRRKAAGYTVRCRWPVAGSPHLTPASCCSARAMTGQLQVVWVAFDPRCCWSGACWGRCCRNCLALRSLQPLFLLCCGGMESCAAATKCPAWHLPVASGAAQLNLITRNQGMYASVNTTRCPNELVIPFRTQLAQRCPTGSLRTQRRIWCCNNTMQW